MDLMAMIENAMTSPVIYLAILALAILDAFLPFLPSESVVIAAAVFAVSGIPSLPLIIVLAALGAFVGNHIGYLGGAAFESNSMLGLTVGLGLALSITALGELVRYVLRRRRAATAPDDRAQGPHPHADVGVQVVPDQHDRRVQPLVGLVQERDVVVLAETATLPAAVQPGAPHQPSTIPV
ncbi:hypothetical protein [Micromonospora sp. NPDC049374]|uniref:DedA family protein n=1 Tax=Micromonospora sp. NPDC049374 TaxID=3154352 RepID=UPI003428C92E